VIDAVINNVIDPVVNLGRKLSYPSGKLHLFNMTISFYKYRDNMLDLIAACPTLLAYGNSRFCIFEIYKTGP
jgi:hypothetical protein